MTSNIEKRTLPLNPHPDHLRKEAKARLADMRKRVPGVRLADAQFIVAREYGFANWAALQAEVGRRFADRPRSFFRRVWLPSIAGHDRDEWDPLDANASFFRAGVAAQVGFFLVALIGVALVVMTQGQMRSAHSLIARLALLAHTIL